MESASAKRIFLRRSRRGTVSARVLRLAFMVLAVLALICSKYRPWFALCFLLAVFFYVAEHKANVRYALIDQFLEDPSRVFWIYCVDVNTQFDAPTGKYLSLPRYISVVLHFTTGDVQTVDVLQKDVENVAEWLRGLNPAAFLFDPFQINDKNPEPSEGE